MLLLFISERCHESSQPLENFVSIDTEEKYDHDQSQDESYGEVNFQVLDFS